MTYFQVLAYKNTLVDYRGCITLHYTTVFLPICKIFQALPLGGIPAGILRSVSRRKVAEGSLCGQTLNPSNLQRLQHKHEACLSKQDGGKLARERHEKAKWNASGRSTCHLQCFMGVGDSWVRI